MHRTLADALARGRGVERAFLCPVHNDTSPSASVNTVKGLWYCYTCGAKGKVTGEVDADDQSFAADIEYLLAGDEQPSYSEGWLDYFTSGGPHPYWTGRGYLPETVEHFRLGYDWDNHMPCYPMRAPDGRLLGIVRRNLDGDPKYLYPKGVSKGKLLHNYSTDARDTVVLVEGAPDVWAAWEVGHEAFGLYGSILHVEQMRLIARCAPKRVVLALDNDRAGREAIKGRRREDGSYVPGIEHTLAWEGYEVVCVPWEDHAAKDLAELDREVRKILLDPLVL